MFNVKSNLKTYIVPKGTHVWLLIDADYIGFLTEREVTYFEEDVAHGEVISEEREVRENEVYFHLPPNDKHATHLIVAVSDMAIITTGKSF